MKKILPLFIALIFSSNLLAGDPDTFYYVSNDDDNLYSVDRSTGVSTLIGATGASEIEAIAYYPIPGANVLYATDAGDFGSLNLTTGLFTLISEVDAAGPANGALGPQSFNDIDGMMLDGQTFIMWATERNSGNDFLFQIDVNTGQYIKSAFGPGIDYLVVNGPGINLDIDDMAISPITGRMYASNNDGGSGDHLIEINKYTAVYTVTSTLADDDFEGLTFHNDGTLYGVEGDDDRMSVITIATGAVSGIIDLSPTTDIESLASLVADANTVSGTVYNDLDLDGVLDIGETGVSGVTVYLWVDNDSDGMIDPEDTRVQTTTTDGSGNYTFYYASTATLLISTQFASYPASSALTTDNVEEATFADGVNFAETDANNNFGIGTGPDCDEDGIPNFFEAGLDSDGDGIRDSCDLDSDNDGIRDNVEGIEDFDDDGIPNYRDRDSDDDGIPDAIEANRGAAPAGYNASNGNVSGVDSDGNGIVDSRETAAGSGIMVAPNPESDNDGKHDYLDLDSDNDGILDIIEAGGEDSDHDGQVDGLLDANSNGLDDRIETTPLAIPNTDLAFETTNGLTNLPNYIDIDSDSDGIDDTREGYSTSNYGFPTLLNDTDDDGIIDFWDVSNFSTPITPYDRDTDGIPDYIDSDSDQDGVSDLIEGNDANGDGIVDVVLSGVDNDNNGLDDALDGDCGAATVLLEASTHAEENNSDGTVNLGSGDLEMINDGGTNQTIGLRFTNVDVNQGETVTSAFIQFEADGASTGAITITIEGELSTNAADFTTGINNVSGRTNTVASISWSPSDWNADGENGTNQRTVNVGSIIQEIVNQGGWVTGNSLVFIITGPAGNSRNADTDPLLIINKAFDSTPTLSFIATDHAEEDNTDGSVDIFSGDLELPNETNNQTIGVLFGNVGLVQGQIVTSAHIQFEADEIETGAITITIEGELTNNSAFFTTAINDVSGRSTTTASASWNPADWNVVGESGAPQQTVDITALVQEIVNQGGWIFGNNMTFIFTGPAGNRRTAEIDPILVIETTASFSVCGSSVAHQDFDTDNEDDFRDTDDDGDGIPTSSEIPDGDGSGIPDYLERDLTDCGFGYVTSTGTSTGSADLVVTQTGVTDPNDGIGAADGFGAELFENGDIFTLDLTDVLPLGATYSITWAERGGESGTASMILQESQDGITWTTHPAPPTTNSTSFINSAVIANVATRFVRISKDNPPSATDFLVDAVTYSAVTECAIDSDNDRIADYIDIDDDNDGVLDTAESLCSDPSARFFADPEAYWTMDNTTDDATVNGNDANGGTAPTFSTTSIQGTHSASFNGTTHQIRYSIDGGFMEQAYTDISFSAWIRPTSVTGNRIIYEEGGVNNGLVLSLNAGVLTFTARSGGVGSETSVAAAITLTVDNVWHHVAGTFQGGRMIVYLDGVSNGVIAGFVNIPAHTGNGGIGGLFGAAASSATLNYAGLLDAARYNSDDVWSAARVGFEAQRICDNDGDGVGNHLDLDSDNDGIPDLQEAGGSDNNTDGKVDDPTDTDGDGWADTFDPDNGGTVLPDGDKDSDGFKNRLDIDADNDGIADIIEAGGVDANNDGRADDATDTDGDGYANIFDNDNEGSPLAIGDEDNDGIRNYLDLDSDNDGIIDNVEGQTTGAFQSPLGLDGDNDGWDNRYDSNNGGTAITLSNNEGFGKPDYLDDDSDGDSFRDWVEGFDDDEDGDALDDLILRATNFETAAGNPAFYVNGTDTDSDGIPDWLEDDDGDNVPNFLDFGHANYHDTDNDGIIDLYDTDNSGIASILPDGDSDGEYDFRDTDNKVSLPITLVTFNAIKNGKQVDLKWITSSEINNDYFTVEKSIDGVNWKPFAKQAGAGNSNVLLNYDDIDDKPYEGVSYYRLKQTDFDGAYAYSEIVAIYFNSESNLAIYPNPTTGIFIVDGEGIVEIKIYNTTGKIIYNGISKKEIDLSNQPRGIYFVEVNLGGSFFREKVIVN